MLTSLPPPSFVARGATPSTIRRAVDRRGLAIFGAATAAALLLGGVMLFAIWARTRVTSAGYELARTAREGRDLLSARDSLRVTVAQLRSPQRLAQVAKKLGMGPAPADRTVVIDDRQRSLTPVIDERQRDTAQLVAKEP